MFVVYFTHPRQGEISIERRTLMDAHALAEDLSHDYPDTAIHVFRPVEGAPAMVLVSNHVTFSSLKKKPYDKLGMLALHLIDVWEDDMTEIISGITQEALKWKMGDIDDDGFFRMTDETRDDYDKCVGLKG